MNERMPYELTRPRKLVRKNERKMQNIKAMNEGRIRGKTITSRGVKQWGGGGGGRKMADARPALTSSSFDVLRSVCPEALDCAPLHRRKKAALARGRARRLRKKIELSKILKEQVFFILQ